jgi:uncharacterized protein (TIGR02001 family)
MCLYDNADTLSRSKHTLKGFIMQKKLLVVALSTLFTLPAMAADAPAAAPAPAVTGNFSLATNYVFRGMTQTGEKPAIQGGFDYTHASGFYAGAWGSSISWISDEGMAANAGTEIDTYFGFKNSFATDFNYDVGFLRYNYPGTYSVPTKADTDELYGLIGYKWVTAKYSYATGDTFGVKDAKGSSYIDLSANYSLADTGITLGGHYGKQTIKGPNAGTGASALTYSDYKLSVSKDFSGYVLGLAYTNTNAEKAPYTYAGKFFGKAATTLSLSRSF